MLRKIRIAAAAFFFVLTTLLFLDFTGTLHAWFGWMAKIQFLPALLALNVGVVAFLVILTLLFGRVYCSVICPLGVMQDIVSWASGKRRKHRNRFAYSPALTWLRRGMLVVFVAAMLAGVGSLLAPYSAYGRIASNLLAPVYAWGNNLLAYLAERAGSYAFYTVDVWVKGAATLAVAAGTFIVLAVLFTIIVAIVNVGYVLSPFGKQKEPEKTLKITIPDDLEYDGVFDEALARYTDEHELVEVQTTNMGSLFRLDYQVVLKNRKEEKKMIDDLRCRNGNLEILCSRTAIVREEL